MRISSGCTRCLCITGRSPSWRVGSFHLEHMIDARHIEHAQDSGDGLAQQQSCTGTSHLPVHSQQCHDRCSVDAGAGGQVDDQPRRGCSRGAGENAAPRLNGRDGERAGHRNDYLRCPAGLRIHRAPQPQLDNVQRSPSLPHIAMSLQNCDSCVTARHYREAWPPARSVRHRGCRPVTCAFPLQWIAEVADRHPCHVAKEERHGPPVYFQVSYWYSLYVAMMPVILV